MRGRNPTNSDLMQAIIALANRQTEDRVLLSTLRDSYRQRTEKAQRFEDDTRVKLTTITTRQGDTNRRLAAIEPTVKRIQMRELVRRALLRCAWRWWKVVAGAGVAGAGVAAWANEWFPRIGKLLGK